MRLPASALLVATLAVAGCGGDDEGKPGGGSQSPPPDQAQTATVEGATTPGGRAEDAPSESGGGNGRRSHPKPPSLAEYVQRADRICRTTQLTIAKRGGEYRDLTKAFAQGKIEQAEYLRRSGRLTERSGEVAQRAVVHLKELRRPASRRDAIAAYLRGATRQSAILTAQGRALRGGRNKEVAKLNGRIAQAGAETRRAARRVGFHVCGGGS
jgi:hypothetical protein